MRARPTRWLLVAALAIVLGSSAAHALEVEARLDRPSIAPGETAELLLRVRGAQDEIPDLSPLQRDFEVLDLRRNQRTTIVNGRRDVSVDWWIELAPRSRGRIEIPALRVGAAESEPLELEVASTRLASAPGPQPGAPVAVALEVDEEVPYVQSRVLLTVRVLADGSVIDGALGEPSVENAVVERVGDDRQYTTEVNGAPHTVIERDYAIFPQRSGPLTIAPLAFEGRARERAMPRSRRRRSVFDPSFDAFFSAGLGGGLLDDFFGPPARGVRAVSPPLALEVKPRPEQAEGDWWIPARSVELVEEWESGPPSFRVGEPVTRILAIRATGLSGAQLPELALPEVEGLKQYAEPAVDETFTAAGEVVAVKAQKTALIPTREGELTLPELELSWWDTATDETRTARLPARTVWVRPADSIDHASAPAAAAPPEGGEPDAPASAAVTTPTAGLWLMGGLTILVAFAALGWLARRNGAAPPADAAGSVAQAARALRVAEQDLGRACAAGDERAASIALYDAARARDPEASTHGALAWARQIGAPPLERAIIELGRVRYSTHSGHWDGSELWRAYREAVRGWRRRSKGVDYPLPSLYPTG